MEETVRLPGCYYITKEDYINIKNARQSAVIYFERSECGDCTALNPGLLRSYVNKNPKAKRIYVLDCQPYWKASTDADYESYLNAKNELGISNVNNPYGFGAGVFPFFTLIENGQYTSGAVVYNDTVNNELVVTESYYTTERVASLEYTNTVIQGMQLTENDVSKGNYKGFEYVLWNQESADKVYESILNSFLDYALPKTTVTL